MVTIDDIAKKMKVSKVTVSKALNGAFDVSETMRKSILETAVEMGYTKPLRKKEAPRFCVFAVTMAYRNPEDFGSDIITGFRKMAEPAGCTVAIQQLDAAFREANPSFDGYMLEHNYAGALFLDLNLQDPWLKQLHTSRTPAVLLDNYVMQNAATAYIGTDNDEAMYLAIQHLKELGHQKIGYLSGTLNAYINQVRYEAFFHALQLHSLPCDRELAGTSNHLLENLQVHFPRLMQQGVTAFMCSHDLLAHGLMLHCQDLHIRVPEDISIVGFDDLPICAYTNPPLTTIRQDRTQMGKSAYYALSSLAENIPISTLLLHPRLIVRNSTGAPPVHAENSCTPDPQ